MLTDRPVPRIPFSDKEVLLSRLLAVVAAACLLTVATAQVLDLGPVRTSHPRNWVVAVVCCTMGLRIVAHTRRNAVGWLVLVMGLCGALAVGAEAWSASFFPAWSSTWVWWPSYALMPVAGLLFPDGRLLSARWRPVLVVAALGVVLPIVGIGWASWGSPATFWRSAVEGSAARGLPATLTGVGVLCVFAGLISAVIALAMRWRGADRGERRLLAWLVVCAVVLVPALLFEMVSSTTGAWLVFAAAFPIATLVAILRYGLYDIDLLVHRSVLFGLLGLILLTAYVATVLVLTSMLPTAAHTIATVAVVLMLGPLHRYLRARVDRWLYGDRADPHRALSRLGEQLENLLRPDQAFAAVARSVADALKLPYVAITEERNGRARELATYGTSRAWPQTKVPVMDGGHRIGAIVVESRAPEEGFGRRDLGLLTDLARQVALAARSDRLAKALQRTSEERDEDLRRLTGELHDSVGPSVEALRLQADALRTSIAGRDAVVVRKLDVILEDLETVSAGVGQLVRGVRPENLHLGLVEAVRRRAEGFERAGFTVRIKAVGAFEHLPASIEFEAYRIVSEALTNVVRHANASACQVRMVRTADFLEIKVADNGVGLPPDVDPGVGLGSMRDRCESRGGSFRIDPVACGTRVVAVLPLPARHEEPDGH